MSDLQQFPWASILVLSDLQQFPWASILVLITALSVLSKIVYDYAATKQIQTEMVRRSELLEKLKEQREAILQEVRQILDDRLARKRGG